LFEWSHAAKERRMDRKDESMDRLLREVDSVNDIGSTRKKGERVQ